MNPQVCNPVLDLPLTRPSLMGNELEYVTRVIESNEVGADGTFTRLCSELLQARLGTAKVLLTTSCTVALEIAAMLCGLRSGDEVIMPSFTFVSTANAFLRCGGKPVFVDIRSDTLNIDESLIEAAVTSKTKAIAPVHYGGVSCEMDAILKVAERHGLMVIEDAAQGVDAYYKDRALGSIGNLGALSFHVTKNLVCGEGGALCVNDPSLISRAEIIRDKGTNRARFLRGEVDKYTWTDLGCSGAPSELLAALLYAQFERMEQIARLRREVTSRYRELLARLEESGDLLLPRIPQECQSNDHLFYILLQDERKRDELMRHLRRQGVTAAFHYVPLHTSPMGRTFGYRRGDLPVTEELSDRLLRLPCYPELTASEQELITEHVTTYFQS